jgi:hypothetical protein
MKRLNIHCNVNQKFPFTRCINWLCRKRNFKLHNCEYFPSFLSSCHIKNCDAEFYALGVAQLENNSPAFYWTQFFLRRKIQWRQKNVRSWRGNVRSSDANSETHACSKSVVLLIRYLDWFLRMQSFPQKPTTLSKTGRSEIKIRKYKIERQVYHSHSSINLQNCETRF